MDNKYEIGLWAGKEVAVKVDAFITLHYWSNTDNFDPVKREVRQDGSVVYHWLNKPKMADEMYNSCLRFYSNANCPLLDRDESAFKLVDISNDSSRTRSNHAGERLFEGIYAPKSIMFPEGFYSGAAAPAET